MPNYLFFPYYYSYGRFFYHSFMVKINVLYIKKLYFAKSAFDLYLSTQKLDMMIVRLIRAFIVQIKIFLHYFTNILTQLQRTKIRIQEYNYMFWTISTISRMRRCLPIIEHAKTTEPIELICCTMLSNTSRRINGLLPFRFFYRFNMAVK